jgi:hypothetical protein
MIQDQELWNKLKNRTGTEKEVKRLEEIRKEGKITTKEWFLIRSHWLKNAKTLRDKN